MVKVRVFDQEFRINNLTWSGPNREIVKILNTIDNEVTGFDPDPDYTAALKAVEMFNGKIIEFGRTKVKPGLIY